MQSQRVGSVLANPVLVDFDGRERDLRRGRGPQVVIRGDARGDVRDFVRELAARTDELDVWGAEILVVVPDRSHVDDELAVTWLLDTDVRLDTDASVIVTDEWGEAYFVAAQAGSGQGGAQPGAQGRLPSAADVVEWVRFVAIQCPECEGPEGGWRDL